MSYAPLRLLALRRRPPSSTIIIQQQVPNHQPSPPPPPPFRLHRRPPTTAASTCASGPRSCPPSCGAPSPGCSPTSGTRIASTSSPASRGRPTPTSASSSRASHARASPNPPSWATASISTWRTTATLRPRTTSAIGTTTMKTTTTTTASPASPSLVAESSTATVTTAAMTAATTTPTTASTRTLAPPTPTTALWMATMTPTTPLPLSFSRFGKISCPFSPIDRSPLHRHRFLALTSPLPSPPPSPTTVRPRQPSATNRPACPPPPPSAPVAFAAGARTATTISSTDRSRYAPHSTGPVMANASANTSANTSWSGYAAGPAAVSRPLLATMGTPGRSAPMSSAAIRTLTAAAAAVGPAVAAAPARASHARSFATSAPLADHTTTTTSTHAATAASAAAPPANNTLAQQLDLLRADVSKLRRVHGATLSAALDAARFAPMAGAGVGGECTTEDALFLLQCCSLLPEKPRPEKLALVEQAWALVVRGTAGAGAGGAADAMAHKQRGAEATTTAQPTPAELCALLREYRTNAKKLQFADFMQLYAPTIDAGGARVYDALLYLAGETGDEVGMVLVLGEMKAAGLAPTVETFNALILGHSRRRSLEKCEQVLERMHEAGCEPTARTWKEMMRAYIENREPERAEQLLAERGADLSVPQVMSVIRTAIRRDDQSQVLRMAFERLPDEILANRYIIPEIRNACVELIQANEARKAFRIIEQLPVPTFSESEDADGYATFFISELIRSGTQQEEVAEMAGKLVESGRNARALHVCCEVALRHGSPDALRYLQELARLERLRAPYFWPLVVREHRTGGETGVLNVLREMAALQVPCDTETLSQWVLPRLPITLTAPVLSGCKQLEDRGLKMSTLLPALLVHLIHQSRLPCATQLVLAYETRPAPQPILWALIGYVRNARNHAPTELAALAQLCAALAAKRTDAFDITGQMVLELIANPAKRLPYEVLLRMLRQFRVAEVRMSKFAADVVAQYWSRCADEEQREEALKLLEVLVDRRLTSMEGRGGADAEAEHIKHPRDMTLEELECHLLELKEKGGNTRGILRRLLQQNVRAGRLERAAEVHAECLRQSVSLSAGMVAAIMELSVRQRNLPAAEAALRQMYELFPAFNVDEHKIVDLAALLVEHQKLQTAKEVLRRRARSSGSAAIKGGAQIQKNVWQLLTNVALLSADAGQPLQARGWFEFLVELGYCEPHNTVLGPLVRECLHKGLLREAAAEYHDVAQRYRCTPLQFELMTRLIAATNQAAAGNGGTGRQPSEPAGGSDAPAPALDAAEAKELLQQVIETATRCHGPQNANVALVVAFAHSGSDAQVRKILIDPTVRHNMPAILKQCEYLCETGALDPLLRLAKCSRGLSGAVQERDFYALLMAQYVRQNEWQPAMRLFERLQADGEFKVQTDFVRQLVALLERNGQEVPVQVAMLVR